MIKLLCYFADANKQRYQQKRNSEGFYIHKQ